MNEPLKLLYKKYGFNLENIKTITSGIKYTAIMLNNGNIGVCANLQNKVETDKNIYTNIDLGNFSHRIVLNGYYNALLNYSHKHETGDLFDKIQFTSFNNIVMIGFFKPVVNMFEKNKIPLTIFDNMKSDLVLTSMNDQKQILKNADALILTSTSIFNLTFMDLMEKIDKKSKIFMLGPSSIMCDEIFQYGNIKMIFGATFENFDYKVLKIIENNQGTRMFLKLGNKSIMQN